MTAIRIFLVDDHPVLRTGLRLLFTQEPGVLVVGEAADGAGALASIRALRPDIALIDLDMPGMGGLELARRLCQEPVDTHVLVLAGAAEVAAVQEALRIGVSGFLLKAGPTEELVRAVREVAAGCVYFCPHVSGVIARACRPGSVANGLSEREVEILRRVADGQSTKEIAFLLQLSTKTVESHRTRLMAKIGTDSIAGLTKYAVRERLTAL